MMQDNSANPETTGHEPAAIGVSGIMWGLVAIGATLLVAMLAIAGLMAYLARWQAPTAAPQAAQPPAAPVMPPAGVPALDPRQTDELRRLLAREAQWLSDYAWVDRDQGIARIPIRRAMQMMIDQTASTSAPSHDNSPSD
jgi:hypothetical protein